MDGTGYRIEIGIPTDSEIKSRSKWLRIISVMFFSTLIIALPTMIFGFWGSLLNHNTTGSLIGFIIGGVALSKVAPSRMFVYNPEWCGYVTQDIFRGTMVSYGPGLHASHWWEHRNSEDNYSLKVKRLSFSVGVVTSTAKVTISGEFEYAIDLGIIERAIGVSEDVVERGITAFIENYLTNLYDETTARVIQTRIGEMGEKLSNELMNSDGSLAAIRKKYGYKTVSIIVDKISIPTATQETRDAIDEAEALFEVVARLYGRSADELRTLIANGTISQAEYQKMLVRAMAVSGNRTDIGVKVIEGLEQSAAGSLAATLDALK